MSIAITPRLQKCLDAGDVLALFPLLKDWPDSELRALLDDIEAYHRAWSELLESTQRIDAMKMENFLSAERSAQLDRLYDAARSGLLALTSEIASVAYYYLGDAEEPAE